MFYRPMDILLDKILVGTMSGISSQDWFRITGDPTRFSMLLSDSPYLSFLKKVDANPHMLSNDKMLEETSYFKMADLCLKHMGWYFDATTPQGIREWMRQYYKIYKADSDISQKLYIESHGHSKSGICPVVHRISDSDMYEVYDGHHRLAIALAKGHKSIQVIFRGKKRTFIQEELLHVNQTKGTELYQPVPLPEVQTWSLIRKCDDRLAMMLQFLDNKEMSISNATVLDCACSYGWFVKQFKDKGAKVIGLDRDATALNLGQLIYKLEPADFRHDYLEKFLLHSKDNFDIVLCLSILHHYAIGKEMGSAENIIKRLSEITNNVLFIDTGQSHESWFCKTLPQWNASFIHQFLLEHGSFTEVIPLGVDTDNTGRYRDNYGRMLFACVK